MPFLVWILFYHINSQFVLSSVASRPFFATTTKNYRPRRGEKLKEIREKYWHFLLPLLLTLVFFYTFRWKKSLRTFLCLLLYIFFQCASVRGVAARFPKIIFFLLYFFFLCRRKWGKESVKIYCSRMILLDAFYGMIIKFFLNKLWFGWINWKIKIYFQLIDLLSILNWIFIHGSMEGLTKLIIWSGGHPKIFGGRGFKFLLNGRENLGSFWDYFFLNPSKLKKKSQKGEGFDPLNSFLNTI